MDRKQIENRDQELVNKFRTVVNDKQEGKMRKKTRLKWVSAGVLACCAILVLVLLRPSFPPHQATMTPAVKTFDQGPADAAKDAKMEKPMDIAKNEMPRPGVKTVESPAVLPEKPLPETRKAPEVKQPVVAAKAAPAKRQPEKQLAAAPPATRKPAEKTGRIVRIISCTDVSNLNFVSPTDVFSMSKDKNPVIWMDVSSEKKILPYTLKHVYFVNGRKYCTVPLKIRYPRMRTWSRITLRYGYQVGKWRVDVVDDKGTIIETKEFTVTP